MSLEAERGLCDALAAADALAQRTGEVTMMHPVRSGAEGRLAKRLESAAFSQCIRRIGGVHSLRLFLIDCSTRLVFSAEFDTPVDARLARLCLGCREDLAELWAHCQGFPREGFEDPTGFAAFVAAGLQPSGFRYRAFPQTTVGQIGKALDWMRKTASFQIELAKKPKSS